VKHVRKTPSVHGYTTSMPRKKELKYQAIKKDSLARMLNLQHKGHLLVVKIIHELSGIMAFQGPVKNNVNGVGIPSISFSNVKAVSPGSGFAFTSSAKWYR